MLRNSFFRLFTPPTPLPSTRAQSFSPTSRMYHKRVLDHYNNPRNVGSLDKTQKNVGTGLVGAPACFHRNTLIATAGGPLSKGSTKIRELYKRKEKVPVWSFNISKHIYEIKWAIAIKTEKRKMVKLTFDDGGTVTCTKDHKFLTEKGYIENENLGRSGIVPFNRDSSDNQKIMSRESLEGEFDCYNLQVEENNNYVVMTYVNQDIQTGICVKNCGDVMKLQIEVDPETDTIMDTKVKVFGCGSAIASSSYGSELIKGKTLDECTEVTNKDIARHLSLPPVKLHCSLLMEDAIKAAVLDYKKKQE